MTPLQLSLTEIEALATKSARGADMTWGLAEEAGFATRWLCARGLEGASLLAAYLQTEESSDWTAKAPVIGNRRWSTKTGVPLCPIATGAALSDFALLPDGIGAGRLTLSAIAYPVFLLPFLAGASEQLAVPLRIEFAQVHAVVSGADVLWLSAPKSWGCTVAQVSIGRSQGLTSAAFNRAVQPVAASALSALNALALRTTVPASARSRAGAGSVRSDND